MAVWKSKWSCLNLDVEFMPARTRTAASVALYTVGAIFVIPMAIGVLMVNSTAHRSDHANQVSRDIASMYAQGLDFSNRGNQNIALNVAEGLGLNLRGGNGVLILSRIRVVSDPDCASPGCANKGYPVVTQRYVIGNSALRVSSFGTPASIDAATGNVRNWSSDVSARAQDFPESLKPGEFIYAVECYLASADSPGLYSRAMF